jgi:hypothetical protein
METAVHLMCQGMCALSDEESPLGIKCKINV